VHDSATEMLRVGDGELLGDVWASQGTGAIKSVLEAPIIIKLQGTTGKIFTNTYIMSK
jgi:hypothetical protein